MKRNRDFELLRLATPSRVFSHAPDYDRHHNFNMEEQKKKPLTIFYNGRVASCDATEFQARAIIYLASKGMEKKSNNWAGSISPIAAIYSPTASTHSMKRSLQSFLEKRRSRAQSQS